MNTEYRDDLLSYISDAHKDAYGFRPRQSFADYSDAELESYASSLSDAVVEADVEQTDAYKRCQARFEASVTIALGAGAADRATAVRWVLEANGYPDNDIEHLQHLMGVGFRFDFYTGIDS